MAFSGLYVHHRVHGGMRGNERSGTDPEHEIPELEPGDADAPDDRNGSGRRIRGGAILERDGKRGGMIRRSGRPEDCWITQII